MIPTILIIVYIVLFIYFLSMHYTLRNNKKIFDQMGDELNEELDTINSNFKYYSNKLKWIEKTMVHKTPRHSDPEHEPLEVTSGNKTNK